MWFFSCFLLQSLQGRQCLLEIRSMPQWHSIRTLLNSGGILVLSNGECDLHPQEHPIVDKDLRLDDFQSFEYGILDLV